MKKLYVITGTLGTVKEGRLRPMYFETTYREIAEKLYCRLLKQGWNVRLDMSLLPIPTVSAQAYARQVLGL